MKIKLLSIPVMVFCLATVGCNKKGTNTIAPGDERNEAEEIEDIDNDGDDQLGEDGNQPGDLEDVDEDGDDNL
jgi:hypothetical protein